MCKHSKATETESLQDIMGIKYNGEPPESSSGTYFGGNSWLVATCSKNDSIVDRVCLAEKPEFSAIF